MTDDGSTTGHTVDAVVIGRNEGARLAACLTSLAPQVRRLVYVDSGSTDGSIAAARAVGARVVELDMTRPFTAARARNAGVAALADTPGAFVQFVDGDCVVVADWVAHAAAFLHANPQAAVVCGRRRERHPEFSVYNRLCDREWNTPIGEAAACGGDALMRRTAFDAIGGFDADLIAGEEPDLCLRLRRAGWQVWRLDREMTLHDAAIRRFSQWWMRSRRAGHAFAEGAHRYGSGPEHHWRRETRRALAWGAALPLAVLVPAPFWPPALLLLLAYPAQVVRLARRMGWEAALFTVLGKFPEAQGAIGFHLRRGRANRLIEYK